MLGFLSRKNLRRGLIAGITAASLYASPAYADENLESNVQEFDQHIEPIDVIVEAAFAYGLKLFWHEFGHYSAARLSGYESNS